MSCLSWITISILCVITACGFVPRDGIADEPAFTAAIPAGNYTGPLKIAEIVRFNSLPMRMNLEPELLLPDILREIDPRHPPLFDRVLRDAQDSELLEIAGHSIARVAHEKLADISPSFDILVRHLQEAGHPRLKHVCAMALTEADNQQAAAELLQAAAGGDDPLRLVIEPALSRWRYAPAAEMWEPRLRDRFGTQISVKLACEGLTALQFSSAVPAIAELVQNTSASIGKRLAAAAGLSRLDPDRARELSLGYRTGSVNERLLSVALLSNSAAASLNELSDYCRDSSDGVAFAAWKAAQTHGPELLVKHLDHGRHRNDAGIRMTAAQIMRLFPDDQRCGWLNEMVSDFNLEVRNVARTALERTGTEHPELKSVIIKAAAEKIRADSEDWQGIEQSLVLLGQLAATQFSESCVPLLTHKRPEVSVTAAWLLHLFPDTVVSDAVRAHIELLYRQRDSSDPELMETLGSASLQLAHLSLYAAIMRLQTLQPLLEKNFSKSFPASPEERSAAMWALGLLNQNHPDSKLAGKFASRIQDRDGMPPEMLVVRQMSVRALGMMRATDFTDVVRDAYRIDDSMALIPQAARWSLALLGEQPPPAPLPVSQSVGGWRLNPTQR